MFKEQYEQNRVVNDAVKELFRRSIYKEQIKKSGKNKKKYIYKELFRRSILSYE